MVKVSFFTDLVGKEQRSVEDLRIVAGKDLVVGALVAERGEENVVKQEKDLLDAIDDISIEKEDN